MGVSNVYFCIYQLKTRGTLNVPNLVGGWEETLTALLRKGPVGINKAGGMQSLDSTINITSTKSCDDFLWPSDKPETITISRWPNGKHYYLTSSLNRELPQKYLSIASAKRRARKFVSKEQIIIKPPEFAYKRDGD